MSTPLYTLQGVRRSYAGRTVLDVDQLVVAEGEILAIIGPSGAGKSTLLRLLNFLEAPDAGHLEYAGRRAGPDLPLARRREVTTVFQHPSLLQASVEANLTLGLRLRGRSIPAEELEGLLARLGLKSLRRAPARTLSAGEAQRVALARALLIEPRVLLLDEPTANLDPYNVALIEEVVRAINHEKGTTVVLVTHNIFQARRLATRAGLLLSGRLVELAATRVFFENPGDARTRDFIEGRMIY